ncbi:hypothetical protein KZZ52_33600 [Dactylosporangium sp. AC04546]|uniref:hypothetical protein n=1 Tax=Dactylosporangium sp. AC04546 TaxID=2862460 RepID=UPI001EDF77EC|nr:hypothetical protein [Dactylosporangium sp. AC04546]WVK78911.1 hypothetical protein KZZ52_33600 [Dactylosporangium sp. AC04546]
MKLYAERYGVDKYTAYDDLTALGFALPNSARQWAQRSPATRGRTVERATLPVHDEWWIVLDGRLFFAAGYTAGGAPHGIVRPGISRRT